MPKLIAANWKENPRTESLALKLFEDIEKIKHSKKTEMVICPPFIYLERLAEIHRRDKNTHVALGAQDVFWEDKGPYTGEVGPQMLRSIGVSYVIIGHSERRKGLKETDAMINKKIKLALTDGLNVILCVGEAFTIRKGGVAVAERFVADQLKRDLAGIGASARGAKQNRGKIVIAYEPIWAIGTGRYDDPQDARAMASFIKKVLYQYYRLKPSVLYGGSVTGRNVEDYVQYKEIDGALVGGASLKAGEFKKIITVVEKIK